MSGFTASGRSGRCLRLFYVLLLVGVSRCGFAQGPDKRFPEYPQTRGQLKTLTTPYLPAWLQLDGELRGRIEGQSAINDTRGNSAAYFLTRIRGGAKITPSHYANFYLQFHDNHVLGLPRSQTAANMRDAFDLRQGYVDLHRAGARLIAGRQELKFGSERLIGLSDFANDSRTFDGFNLRIGDRNRVDLFTASVVAIQPTGLDRHGKGLSFHGAYATLNHVLPGFSLQPLLLVGTSARVVDGKGSPGSKAEFTFGGEASGRVGSYVDLSGLFVLQRGRYASQEIDASGGFIKAAYVLPRKMLAARVGIEYDRASGDDRADLTKRRTFNQLYPSNHNVFGLIDLFGFQNIEMERLNIDLAPTKAWTVLIQAGSLSRVTAADALYASNGTTLRNASVLPMSSRSIGHEIDISTKYLIGDDLVINAGYGHLFGHAGNVESAGNGYLSFTYRFAILHGPVRKL